jgi:hypothetical protein
MAREQLPHVIVPALRLSGFKERRTQPNRPSGFDIRRKIVDK